MKISHLQHIFRKCCATCGRGSLFVTNKDKVLIDCHGILDEPRQMTPDARCNDWCPCASELRRAVVTKISQVQEKKL